MEVTIIASLKEVISLAAEKNPKLISLPWPAGQI